MKLYMLLNIQFSFGENYYDAEPTSLWVGLIITLIGAFAGALIGFKLSMLKEKALHKKRLNTEKKYFINTLEKALVYIKQQNDKYIESNFNQKNNSYHYFVTKRLCFKEFQYLSKLNTNNLYEILCQKNGLNSNQFYDLFLSIDYVQDTLYNVEKSVIDNQRQFFSNVELIETKLIDLLATINQRGTFLNSMKQTSTKEFCFIYELIATYNDITSESNDLIAHDFKRIKEVFVKKIKDNWTNEFLDSTIWGEINKKGEIINHYIDKIVVNNKASYTLLSSQIETIKQESNFLEELKNSLVS